MLSQRCRHLVAMIVLLNSTGSLYAALDDPTRSFLGQHCVKCHSGEKPKGDWRIDELSADFAAAKNRERWEIVREQLTSGEMPPAGQPRPLEKYVRVVTEWIGVQLAAARVKDHPTTLVAETKVKPKFQNES